MMAPTQRTRASNVDHGNGPDALSHHNNLAEHGPAADDGTGPFMTVDNKPVLHPAPQMHQSFAFTSAKEEEKAAEKLLANGSNTHITLSAIGFGLLALVTMLGVRIRRGLRPATALAGMEMQSQAQVSTVPHIFTVSPEAEAAIEEYLMAEQLAKIPGVSPLKNAPADYGFDPLGLSKVTSPAFGLVEDELLRTNSLRDAELRHGRLAMLAAAAWPIQELVHPSLAKLAGAPELLSDGRSPSVLNGGLTVGPVPIFLAFFAVAIGYLDVKAEETKAQVSAEDWIPGYYSFDPLNLVGGMSPLAIKNMQAKEINNGRLAMVAVLAYVVQEAQTGEPVISVSEQFFTPLIFYPWVQKVLTDAFGVSSFRV
jgi:hypothetical protein